jgi:hypothetical protein
VSLLARCKRFFDKPHLWLIALVGVIVPRRLRADWRREWEAELRHREEMLAGWDRLDWRNKLDLLRCSVLSRYSVATFCLKKNSPLTIE